MLAKQDVHASPWHEATNHVSAPQNWDYGILMDGQQLLSYVQAPTLEVTSTPGDNSGVANGTENTNSPVLAFEQAFGSTEIGCYSHEVFFSTNTE
jgi:hypothetical protein